MKKSATLKWTAIVITFVVSWTAFGQRATQKKDTQYPLINHAVLFENLPQELIRELRDGSATIGQAVNRANHINSTLLKQGPCEIRGKVSSDFKDPGNQKKYRLFLFGEKVRVLGNYHVCNYEIVYEEAELSKVAKLETGQQIKVTGTLDKVVFSFAGRRPYRTAPDSDFVMVAQLTVHIKDAKLK